ncbi:Protein argonaute-2, partial [Orchesella cincta]
DGKEYSVVKIEAEVQVGVLTQCIREETITKVVNKPGQARQILINVLLKMNAKLNGISFQLAPTITNQFGFQKDPILFLGADVTHPAPNSKSPSVAAITASYDISGICYSMHIQVQPAAQEHIEKLVEVIKRMICEFRDKTHVLPKRVMMFRDGVSEGQFPQIKDVEYRGIKEACRLVQENYDPKITFLIVKKRHHTRFRPVNQRDAVRPKFNIPPGTVVDTVITHPTEMEFFLNSHVGIQGTSKPTRYHVLHDDSNFTMDELERLTYYLCYTFVRCTHPVSVPCVTYYAHIAAFRARALLEKESDNADLKKLQEKMTVKPDLLLKYPMFYV